MAPRELTVNWNFIKRSIPCSEQIVWKEEMKLTGVKYRLRPNKEQTSFTVYASDPVFDILNKEQ